MGALYWFEFCEHVGANGFVVVLYPPYISAVSWHPADYFAWQRGYGVFTLGESQLAKAVSYVENQKTHHKEGTTLSSLERIDE